MTIDHFAGRFRETNWQEVKTQAVWFFYRILYLLGLKKTVWVLFEFDFDSIYSRDGNSPDDQGDWFKGFGSKSGIDTDTNGEEIAAFKCSDPKTGKFEVCRYVRKKSIHKKFFEEEKAYGTLTIGQEKLQLAIPINLKHKFPVTSFAGGDKLPVHGFSYKRYVKWNVSKELKALIGW